ncbi:hypothetical protein J056_003577 [Wallemia ichthyophaga EXF-994]|uniref:Carbohydrate kinase PfkB domain-containing protein n=1 Tax=Wallemia ichthyophaga (strain EXF-994 / CBS 113033) TaxID=1299270 RepID=R9AP77_WALI9|nr:uncharacterized protein J056_003577 [Wallemia ichthyophaga EXF-994]EOR01901.1 hypothetical protein J056_003577 [Wallemia ichthyophaga EXF-994]
MSSISRLKYSAEIVDALATRKPIVALESTILTHGLPTPLNYTTATRLEAVIREQGAVPAHIAVIDGCPRVGLSDSQLSHLSLHSGNPLKISRRDIAPAAALHRTGGTTVAGTITLAAHAGIKHFATGGIGGVHRNAQSTWDVSADLIELSRSPTHVICAGAKSILDTPLTLEYLETHGVTVASVGEAAQPNYNFPAFYSPNSGHHVQYSLSPLQAAQVGIASQGLQSGALFCAPIPPQYAEQGSRIQIAVERAVQESQHANNNILGKDITPWLLNRIAQLTDNNSIHSNIALVENNARIGAQIAVHYHRLLEDKEKDDRVGEKMYPVGGSSGLGALSGLSDAPSTPQTQANVRARAIAETEAAMIAKSGVKVGAKVNANAQKDIPHTHTPSHTSAPADIVIIGAAAIDVTAQYDSKSEPHSTSPGRVTVSAGGVGRNIAEAAGRVLRGAAGGKSAILIAPVGGSNTNTSTADLLANSLRSSAAALHMRTDGFVDPPHNTLTPVVNLLLDNEGELREGVASFDALDQMPFSEVEKVLEKHSPHIIALDGNVSAGVVRHVLSYARARAIPTLYEPTSVAKSVRVLEAWEMWEEADSQLQSQPHSQPLLTHVTPNTHELRAMTQSTSFARVRESSAYWEALNALRLYQPFRDALERCLPRPFTQDGIAQMAVMLLPLTKHVVVKCGAKGVLLVSHVREDELGEVGIDGALLSTSKKDARVVHRVDTTSNADSNTHADAQYVLVQHLPPHTPDRLVNTTGAGDSFVGALLAALAHHQPLTKAIHLAQDAASLTLGSKDSVSARLHYLGDDLHL